MSLRPYCLYVILIVYNIFFFSLFILLVSLSLAQSRGYSRVTVTKPLVIPLRELMRSFEVSFMYMLLLQSLAKAYLRKKLNTSEGQNLSRTDKLPFQNPLNFYSFKIRFAQSKSPLQGVDNYPCRISSGMVCSLNLKTLKGLFAVIARAAPTAYAMGFIFQSLLYSSKVSRVSILN